jgi:carboxypeptidase C (cathepsin A)
VAAIIHYLRHDLKVSTDLPYQYLSRSANRSWNWGSAVEGYVNVVPKLKEAMTANPQLRLFMGAGYFDLTTPYFSQDYSRDHLGLNPSLWQHVVYHTYRSGHQIYNSDAAMKELKEDAAAFFRQAEGP